jgi:hypothetical protein
LIALLAMLQTPNVILSTRFNRRLIGVRGTMSIQRTLRRLPAHLFLVLLLASGQGRAASAITVASDDASQAPYTNGWQAGDNGGTGFGPWTFAFSGLRSDLLYDPQFIDRGPLAGDHLGAPTFALTTGARASQTDTSEVVRALTSQLAVGQTFSFDVDGSILDNSGTPFTMGNTFQLFGTDGQERFALFTSNKYHQNDWTATGDADTAVPAANAFHVAFTLATANTYNLVLTPFGGGSPLFSQTAAPLDGTAGSPIQSFRFSAYGTGSSADGSKELFFDNLSITSPAVTGDYNKNGIVDAADYIVWRKTLGQSGSGLAADGNGNNSIDAADYTVWRTHFGSASAATVGMAINVPEPSAYLYLAGTVYLIGTIRFGGRVRLFLIPTSEQIEPLKHVPVGHRSSA